MAEVNFANGEILAAWRASAAGGGCSELDKAQCKEYDEPIGDGRRLCNKSSRISYN